MDIVDAQLHLWQAEGPDRPWPPGRAVEAQKPYPISYECITLFTEHLPWLQGEDLAWVMGRGVCEWLGWSL